MSSIRVVLRDYSRTEHDDFILNVSDRLGKFDGALELCNKNGDLVGWVIKPIYE